MRGTPTEIIALLLLTASALTSCSRQDPPNADTSPRNTVRGSPTTARPTTSTQASTEPSATSPGMFPSDTSGVGESTSGGAATHEATGTEAAYFLVDLPALETVGNWGQESVTVNGNLLTKSLISDNTGVADALGDVAEGQYNLQRKCSHLTFTAGIPDDTSPDTTTMFSIFSDGKLVAHFAVSFGREVYKVISLPNTLRLRLVMESQTHKAHSAVFGDAQVRCRPLA